MISSGPARPLPAEVAACTERLRATCKDEFVAAIFFGSKLVQTSPNQHSASDLFVIVEDYSRAYRLLVAAGVLTRPPWLLTLTNRWLPPNVLRIGADADSAGCKCFFLSAKDLARELSPRSRDHFCKGRLSQTVQVVAARDLDSAEKLERQLEQARVDSLSWVAAYLPPRFNGREYCLAMMAQSYRSEIRPESGSRVHEVLEAQGPKLISVYENILLEHGPERGIHPEGDGFRCERPPRRRNVYFAISRVRATLRWSKYVLTFENWLDYIVQKLHRRSSVRIELTARERRYPFLFLWPKALRVLWQLRRTPADPPPDSTHERPEP